MPRIKCLCTLITVLVYVNGTLALADPATGQNREQDKVITGMQRAAAQEILANMASKARKNISFRPNHHEKTSYWISVRLTAALS